MKVPYEVYFISKANRIECMLLCALKRRIDWCESGLRIVSWKYKKVHNGVSETINDAFNRHSRLEFDGRRKIQLRTIGIGDIIVFNGNPYIIGAFGFLEVPMLLWERIAK